MWESGCVWVRRSCDAADIVMKSSYFLLCPGSAVRENHMAIDDHKWQTCRSCRVPAMYLTSANLLFLTFFAFNEINKLCIIGEAQNSDSPRLHQFSPVVRCAKKPSTFQQLVAAFQFLTRSRSHLSAQFLRKKIPSANKQPTKPEQAEAFHWDCVLDCAIAF